MRMPKSLILKSKENKYLQLNGLLIDPEQILSSKLFLVLDLVLDLLLVDSDLKLISDLIMKHSNISNPWN